jgi:hypothetical protein
VEITHRPDSPPPLEDAFRRATRDLIDCGILREDDRILTRHVIPIPHAYVVFDRHRQKHLPSMTEYLESQDIFAAGRYGDWDYYSMEDTILSGRRAAGRVTADRSLLTPVG